MRRTLYLVLAILGFVVPYSFFVSFLVANGPDPTKFVQQLFATPISSFFATDLLLSSVLFVFFLRQEGARYAMGRLWVYVVVLLTVGLSCAWPLFLYARESRIDRRIV
jgi:hypothetical protein